MSNAPQIITLDEAKRAGLETRVVDRIVWDGKVQYVVSGPFRWPL